MRRKRRGRLAILHELREAANFVRAGFERYHGEMVTLPDGSQVNVDTLIKERTQLYRDTWVTPRIDELIDKETRAKGGSGTT